MTNTSWQWLTTENSGLPANHVADIYRDAEERNHTTLGRAVEDRQGRLWFRSKAGVVVYTP